MNGTPPLSPNHQGPPLSPTHSNFNSMPEHYFDQLGASPLNLSPRGTRYVLTFVFVSFQNLLGFPVQRPQFLETEFLWI